MPHGLWSTADMRPAGQGVLDVFDQAHVLACPAEGEECPRPVAQALPALLARHPGAIGLSEARLGLCLTRTILDGHGSAGDIQHAEDLAAQVLQVDVRAARTLGCPFGPNGT